MLIENLNVVLTGCSRGIGHAILDLLNQNGANVFACFRRKNSSTEKKIAELTTKYKNEIWPIYFDFENLDEVKAGTKQILSEKKTIHAIINNAGVILTAPFLMTSLLEAKRLFDVNFFHQMIFNQALIKNMVRQKSGSVVQISSSAAMDGIEGRAAYASSKAAIESTTKVMAKEFGNFNIRVNAISPGLTQTDMMKNSTPKEALNIKIQSQCLKRVASPKEIASVALFLISPLSTFLTGQIIRVDGGM